MPTTTIFSNGHLGDDLELLFDRLANHPLDRTFEYDAFGSFITTDPVNLRGEPMGSPGAVSFFGNFFTYSHVFNVLTDDAVLIERLTTAVRANQLREDYLDQPPYFDSRKLQIVRHRFSTTQGEVELIYDGRRLEQYGDTITMNGRGGYDGLADQYWFQVARKFLADEHAKQRAAEKRAQAA